MIHTLNFNNYIELHPLAQKCVMSWRKELPDENIKIWDESNIDNEFLNTDYFRYFIKKRMYGVALDSVKSQIVYKYGGMFLDPDIEFYPGFGKKIKMLNSDEEFNITSMCNKNVLSDVSYYQKNSKILQNLINEYKKQHVIFESSDWEIGDNQRLITDADTENENARILQNSKFLLENELQMYYNHWNLNGYYFGENKDISFFNKRFDLIFILTTNEAFLKTIDYIKTHNNQDKQYMYYSNDYINPLICVETDKQGFNYKRHHYINIESLRMYFYDVLKRLPELKSRIIDFDNVLLLDNDKK